MVTASAIAVCVLLVPACGGSARHAGSARTVASRPATPSPADDVLSVSGLGVFEGRCPRGAHEWTLRFIDVDAANDAIAYTVGRGARRVANVNPGQAISFHLVPDAMSTHESADRFVPPGQRRGLISAMAVPTTAPLRVKIYQATEPQTLRADIRLALAALGGESGQCGLVGSTVNAYAYPTS